MASSALSNCLSVLTTTRQLADGGQLTTSFLVKSEAHSRKDQRS